MFSTGFGDLDRIRRNATKLTERFFLSTSYGGFAWETSGSAGFEFTGSPTRAWLPPFSFGDEQKQFSSLEFEN
jgi:hypothetical protein